MISIREVIWMNRMELLAMILEYIEQNISTEIGTLQIANACYCSKSTLEKLFKNMNNTSVQVYIRHRRMTLAAKNLIMFPEKSILDIAVSYGYGSHEAFTRAFAEVWHCTPSEYRKKHRYFELYPRLLCPRKIGDDYMDNRKQVDISELYDLLQERKDCYFICCDIKELIPINNISHKAGDIAIIESLKRMDSVCGEEDFVFRIGGDEFALITNSKELSYANTLIDKISEKNGASFIYENREIPLTLYCGYGKLEGIKKYSELFTHLHNIIRESK